MTIIIIMLTITIAIIAEQALVQKIKSVRFQRKWDRQNKDLKEKVANIKESRKHISYSC